MSNDFTSFIRSYGYEPKDQISPGKWIRFGRGAAVSARLYEDELGGYLHDWRTGEKFYWFANKDALSPTEYARRKHESETLKQAQEAKQKITYTQTGKLAEKLFNDASKASDSHPYLLKKKVKGYGIRQLDKSLLIPVYSVAGDMQSIQFINEAGNKKFMKSGKMSGGCHFIGELYQEKSIYIAEGYATAASVYEDTKCLTVVAFNAANLINVANDLRKQLPKVEIVIAGDSDPVGRKCAEAASLAVNGTTLIPDFGENHDGHTDWNDYFNHEVTT